MKDILSEKQILSYLGKTDIDYRLHIYDSVPSTNELAKTMLFPGETAADSIIIANTQTAGRGRLRRSFSSPIGGIYISFIFSGHQIIHKEPFLLFAPCVAVCFTLEKLLVIEPKIKWPNDILLDGKKVCGILTETQMSKNGDNIIIGLGINYSTNTKSFPDDIKEMAGSLKAYAKNLSRNKFIAELIKTLDELRVSFAKRQYLSEYKKRMTLLGKEIYVIINNERINAKAIDICSDGGFKMKKENGEIEKVYAGDVSIRSIYQE